LREHIVTSDELNCIIPWYHGLSDNSILIGTGSSKSSLITVQY